MGGLYHKDVSILESMLGYPHPWKSPSSCGNQLLQSPRGKFRKLTDQSTQSAFRKMSQEERTHGVRNLRNPSTLSHSLNSLNGGYIGAYIGDYYGAY